MAAEKNGSVTQIENTLRELVDTHINADSLGTSEEANAQRNSVLKIVNRLGVFPQFQSLRAVAIKDRIEATTGMDHIECMVLRIQRILDRSNIEAMQCGGVFETGYMDILVAATVIARMKGCRTLNEAVATKEEMIWKLVETFWPSLNDIPFKDTPEEAH